MEYCGPDDPTTSVDAMYYNIPNMFERQTNIFFQLLTEEHALAKVKILQGVNLMRERSVDHRYCCKDCKEPYNLVEVDKTPSVIPQFFFIFHRTAVTHTDKQMPKREFAKTFEAWGHEFHAGFVLYFLNSNHFICFAEFEGIWFFYDDMQNGGHAVPSDLTPLEYQKQQKVTFGEFNMIHGCVTTCVVYMRD